MDRKLGVVTIDSRIFWPKACEPSKFGAEEQAVIQELSTGRFYLQELVSNKHYKFIFCVQKQTYSTMNSGALEINSLWMNYLILCRNG